MLKYWHHTSSISYLELKEIETGVPQGTVLAHILYFYICTSDISTREQIAIFADDTALLTTRQNQNR